MEINVMDIVEKALRQDRFFLFGVFLLYGAGRSRQGDVYRWLRNEERFEFKNGTYDDVLKELINEYGVEELLRRVIKPRIDATVGKDAMNYLQTCWDTGAPVQAGTLRRKDPSNPTAKPLLRVGAGGDNDLEFSVFAVLWFQFIKDMDVHGEQRVTRPLVEDMKCLLIGVDKIMPPNPQARNEASDFLVEIAVSAKVNGQEKRFRVWERKMPDRDERVILMQGDNKGSDEESAIKDFKVDDEGLYTSAVWIGRLGSNFIPKVELRRRIQRLGSRHEGHLNWDEERDECPNGRHVIRLREDNLHLLTAGEPNKALLNNMIEAWIVCRDTETL